MHRPLILCPLEIEAKAARKAVGGTCDITRIGIGPEATRNAIHRSDRPPGSTVVLFGTAGALTDIGVACRAATITDADANAWDASHADGVTIVGMDQPVCPAVEKQALARRTGAQAVDCESHAFAPLAIERGWIWGVVRAITDDHHTDLSPIIVNWAGPDGRTRPARVARSLIRNPALIAESIRLGRRTNRALRAAGLLLRQTIDELSPRAAESDPQP